MSSKLDTFIDGLHNLTNDELNTAFAWTVKEMISRISRDYDIDTAARALLDIDGEISYGEFMAQIEDWPE